MAGHSALAPFTGRPGLFISVSSGLLYVNNSIFASYGTLVPVVGNTLNFVYMTLAPNVALAVNQSGFPTTNSLPIALVLTNRSEVLDLQDYRPDWYIVSGGGGGGGGAPTVASTTQSGGASGIGTTTLYTVPNGGDGIYTVYADLVVTTAGAAGTVQCNVTWNNGTTTAGLNSAPFPVNAQGEQAALLGSFYAVGNSAITFSATVSGGAGCAYRLSLRLVYLG